MSGQTKIELLLEFKDLASTGITKARETINDQVKKIKDDISQLKAHFATSFSSMCDEVTKLNTALTQIELPDSIKKTSDAMQGHFQKSIAAIRDEIPSIDNAIKLIGNPYAILAKGVNLLKESFSKMTSAAADFQSKFLQIENLNADKPKKSILEYEKSIKDTAMTIGTDLGKTTEAYATAQKETRAMGKSLENIVNPIARFSRAMGTDLTADMDLASKSVKAFKLETKGSEAYMKSSFKTIQMTGLSYSDLAKNQMKFKDATIESSQSIDNANKMFTAFKSITGDASKASEMTKTALLGLKDKSVSEGLAKMGIILEDGKGNARDYSSIIQDVNTHFKNMSPAAIKETIASIGGSGGLSDLFIGLNKKASIFNKTIDKFDSSNFNMDEAFERAMGSYNQLKKTLGENSNTLMSALGKEQLPIVSSGLELINNAIVWMYKNLDNIKDVLVALGYGIVAASVSFGAMWIVANAGMALFTVQYYALAAVQGIATAAQWAWNAAMSANPIGLIAIAIGLVVAGFVLLYKKCEPFRAWVDGIAKYISDLYEKVKKFFGLIFGSNDKVEKTISVETTMNEKVGKKIKPSSTYKEDHTNSLLESKGLLKADGSRDMAKIEKLDLLNAGKQIDQEKLKAYKQPKEEEKQEEKKEEQKKGIPGVSQSSTASTENATVPASFTGMGTASTASKNVSIHVDSFVKGGINMLSSEGDGLSLSEIEDRFNEMFTRMLRRVETAQ